VSLGTQAALGATGVVVQWFAGPDASGQVVNQVVLTNGSTYEYVNGAWAQTNSQGIQQFFAGVDSQGRPATITLFGSGAVSASNSLGTVSLATATPLATASGLATGWVAQWYSGPDASGRVVNQVVLTNGSTYEYVNGAWAQMASQGVQQLFAGVDAQGRPATSTLDTNGAVSASNVLGTVSLGTNLALATGGVVQWFVGVDANGLVVNQVVLTNGSTYEYVNGAWAQTNSHGVQRLFAGVDAQGRPATIALYGTGAVYAANAEGSVALGSDAALGVGGVVQWFAGPDATGQTVNQVLLTDGSTYEYVNGAWAQMSSGGVQQFYAGVDAQGRSATITLYSTGAVYASNGMGAVALGKSRALAIGDVVQWFVGPDANGQVVNQVVLTNGSTYEYVNGTWTQMSSGGVQRLFAGVDAQGLPATIALYTNGSVYASNGYGAVSLGTNTTLPTDGVVQWFTGQDTNGLVVNQVVLTDGSTYEYVNSGWTQTNTGGVQRFFAGVDAQGRKATVTLYANGAVTASNAEGSASLGTNAVLPTDGVVQWFSGPDASGQMVNQVVLTDGSTYEYVNGAWTQMSSGGVQHFYAGVDAQGRAATITLYGNGAVYASNSQGAAQLGTDAALAVGGVVQWFVGQDGTGQVVNQAVLIDGSSYEYVNGAWAQMSSGGVVRLFAGVDAQGRPATIALYRSGAVYASNGQGTASLGTEMALVSGVVVQWFSGPDASGLVVNQVVLTGGSTYEYVNGGWNALALRGVQELFPGVDAQGRLATITLYSDGAVGASNGLGAVWLGINPALAVGGVVEWFVGQDASGLMVNQAVLTNGSTYEYVNGAWAQMSSTGVQQFYAGVDAQGRPATITLLESGAVYASNGQGVASLGTNLALATGGVVQWFVGQDASGVVVNQVVLTNGSTSEYLNSAWAQTNSQGVQQFYTGVDGAGRPATITLLNNGAVFASNGEGAVSLGTNAALATGGIIQWFVGLDAGGLVTNQVVLTNGSTYEYVKGAWAQTNSQGVQQFYTGVDTQGRPATVSLGSNGAVYASNAQGVVALGTNLALAIGGVVQWFAGQDASGQVVNQVVLTNGSTYEYVNGAWAQMASQGVQHFYPGVDAHGRPATVALYGDGAVYASNGQGAFAMGQDAAIAVGGVAQWFVGQDASGLVVNQVVLTDGSTYECVSGAWMQMSSGGVQRLYPGVDAQGRPATITLFNSGAVYASNAQGAVSLGTDAALATGVVVQWFAGQDGGGQVVNQVVLTNGSTYEYVNGAWSQMAGQGVLHLFTGVDGQGRPATVSLSSNGAVYAGNGQGTASLGTDAALAIGVVVQWFAGQDASGQVVNQVVLTDGSTYEYVNGAWSQMSSTGVQQFLPGVDAQGRPATITLLTTGAVYASNGEGASSLGTDAALATGVVAQWFVGQDASGQVVNQVVLTNGSTYEYVNGAWAQMASQGVQHLCAGVDAAGRPATITLYNTGAVNASNGLGTAALGKEPVLATGVVQQWFVGLDAGGHVVNQAVLTDGSTYEYVGGAWSQMASQGVHGEDERAVQRQSRHRRPAYGRQGYHPRAVPAEVLRPCLRSGVEQRHLLTGVRIGSGLFRPLPERTRHAGPGEVLGHRRAAPSARDHVVDMERSFLTELRQPTVLAPVPGPKHDLGVQAGGDVAHGATRSARSRNKVRNSDRLTSPSASSRSCVVSGCPES
jgi:uncharacterized protein affecting Mg2+/Co2+ transport